MVTAATFQKEVEASLQVEQLPPQLKQLHLSRVSPSGVRPDFAISLIPKPNTQITSPSVIIMAYGPEIKSNQTS